MANLVLDINDRRPIWTLPEWVASEIRAAAPSGWTIQVMSTAAEGTGDGAAGTDPEVLKAVADAEVYVGFGITEEVLHAGPGLRWVHSGSAGISSSLTPEMLRRDIVFTNSAGVHGPPMAEAVIGMLLYFWRGFDLAVAASAKRRWGAETFYAGDVAFPEFSECTVGVFGLGGIGLEVAQRATALGASVIGLKRTEPASGAIPESVDVRVGLDNLQDFLGACDAVVITAPDTSETHGLFNNHMLQSMKPGAVLVNVSRGAVVDEDALVAVLRSGHLRGAGLDVFTHEPLPPASALWELPNVLITPHVSPLSSKFWRRQTDLIVDNLRRHVSQQPLRNVVNKSAGY